MDLTLRAASPSDATAIAALHPYFGPADLAVDGTRHLIARELASGRIIGCAATWPQGGDGRCHGLRLTVHPDYRGRGVGSHLLTQVRDDLHAAGAGEVQVWLREQNPRAEQFYARHGFETYRRTIQLHLDLAAVDEATLATYEARAVEQGVRLVTLEDELGRGFDVLHAWHAMVAGDELPGLSYEAFLERAVQRWTIPGSCCFARLDERYVGYGMLLRPGPGLGADATADLGLVEQGYVRVLPEYRRRGLGLALAAACVRCAQRCGYHTLWADVAETNLPSLAVKARLGYREVRRERWLRRQLP